MRGLARAAALLACASLGAGCFTTRLATGRLPLGPPQVERQWFALGGLVPLSPPAGSACPEGVAEVTSELAGVDILIHSGLSLAGIIVGASTCRGEASAACSVLASSLATFLFSSRTVSYTCAADRYALGPGPGGSAAILAPSPLLLAGRAPPDPSGRLPPVSPTP